MYPNSIVMHIMTYITLLWLYMNKMHMKPMKQCLAVRRAPVSELKELTNIWLRPFIHFTQVKKLWTIIPNVQLSHSRLINSTQFLRNLQSLIFFELWQFLHHNNTKTHTHYIDIISCKAVKGNKYHSIHDCHIFKWPLCPSLHWYYGHIFRHKRLKNFSWGGNVGIIIHAYHHQSLQLFFKLQPIYRIYKCYLCMYLFINFQHQSVKQALFGKIFKTEILD